MSFFGTAQRQGGIYINNISAENTMSRHLSLLTILATAFVALNCAFDNDQKDYLEGQRADNVRDLTPVDAKYIVVPEATTVQFAKQHAELQKVKPGDIIVSDVNAGAPQGFIKKVTAVSENAGTTTIQTEPTSITEAVVDGDARAEGILNPAGDNSLLTGATYNPLNGKVETIQPQAGVTVYGMTQPYNAIPECKSKRWYVEFKDVKIQNSGTVNGCVGMDLKFVLDMKIRMFKLKNAEFSVNPSITTKINVAVSDATFEISRAQVTLTTFHLQPIAFTIGMVPVVVVPRIAIVLGVDGKVTASLTTSIQYAASAKAGILYANDRWTQIKEKSSTYNIVSPIFAGNIDAMVYAGPEATFLFYGVAGPGANLYVYSHFKVDWIAAISQPRSWEVWLGFEAGAHFTVEAFGRTLFKINEPSLIGYEGLVASSQYAGIAPPGTGRVTGVIGQAIQGNYQRSDGGYNSMSGDFVTVGKLVGTLAKR